MHGRRSSWGLSFLGLSYTAVLNYSFEDILAIENCLQTFQSRTVIWRTHNPSSIPESIVSRPAFQPRVGCCQKSGSGIFLQRILTSSECWFD